MLRPDEYPVRLYRLLYSDPGIRAGWSAFSSRPIATSSKPQRHIGFGQGLATILAPAPNTLTDPAVAAIEAARLYFAEQL